MKPIMTEEERSAARRAYMQSYYAANKDKYKGYRDKQDKAKKAEYHRAYQTSNKKALAEKAKAWREANHAELLARKAAYRKKNGKDIAAKQRAYHAATREDRNEYSRTYQKENKERRRAYTEKNRGRIREVNRVWARAKYNRKIEELAGRPRPAGCEACGDTNGKKPLVFDHCHKHGHFRGWLCNGCNTAIGHAKDDPQRLIKLAEYLIRSQHSLPGI